MSDPVQQIAQALASGELAFRDLGARKVARHIGRTTGVIYHHYGSLDGFVLQVVNAGWALMAVRLGEQAEAPLVELAVEWLRFAFDHPELYRTMTEYPFDWDEVRDAEGVISGGGLELWDAVVERVRACNADSPEDHVRALYAMVHGLAIMALSGRANVREVHSSDQEVAIRVARLTLSRLLPVEV